MAGIAIFSIKVPVKIAITGTTISADRKVMLYFLYTKSTISQESPEHASV